MKKMYLILFLVAASIFAAPLLRFTLHDGEVITGWLICENQGRLTLKTQESGTVSVWKRSIKLFGDEDITGRGRREFMLGEEHTLVNKNEIAFIIDTRDAARVRLRRILPDGSVVLFGEQSGVSGDTLIFLVPDGRFYEAVEYTRGDTINYYGFGAPFDLNSRCNTFEKREISLRGFAGENIPQLRGDKMRFQRDGE